MRIGYLHLGSSTGGLYRYSRLLAAEARTRSELTVVEADHPSILVGPGDLAALRRAGRQLSGAEVVHLQYNTRIWGPPRRQRPAVAALLSECAAPLVVTLHDVYPCYGTVEMVRRAGARLYRKLRPAGWPPGGSPRIHAGRPTDRTLGWRRGATAGALRLIARRAAKILVCTKAERDRLSSLGTPLEATIVPHFVEVRPSLPAADDARRWLGVENRRVITLLGTIVARKGHPMLLDAIPRLPADVLIVFAGGAAAVGSEYVAQLARQIDSPPLVGRARMTGYLPEARLEQWLAATHLAVCPFHTVSASGSLASWISADRPIVASDLPQIAELNRDVPGAIRVFRPHTSEALAAAIAEHLADRGAGPDPAVAQLRQLRALPAIFDQHLAIYRQVATDPTLLSKSKGTAL